MQITDIAIDDNKKIIVDKFDFLLQEIDILFDTSKGEVLGEDTFGTAFENFLWDLDINNAQISEYVKNNIINQTVSGKDFDIDVDTKILYGTVDDIIIISITIRDPETNQEKNIIYKYNKKVLIERRIQVIS